MNGLPEVNGITENDQESQENTLCKGKQNPAGAGTPGMTIKREEIPEGYTGRTPEEIAACRSVSGTAEMKGAWGE